jgi:phage tail-like protein
MGTGSTPPDVYTISYVTVSIQDVAQDSNMSTLLFQSAKPPDWSVEAPKHVFHGDKGAPESIIAAVQKPQYGSMTLTQGWDKDGVLAKWMGTISDPGKAITDKKKQIDVNFMTSDGNALFTWHADHALLTGYSHSASDASSNAVLSVTATIDADDWQLFQPGGSTPFAL